MSASLTPPPQKVAVFPMREWDGEERCSCSVAHGAVYLFHPHRGPLSANAGSGVYITVSDSVLRADVWRGRRILESLLKVIEMSQ